MDNLTHSLIGAVLGQAGLKRKTGLAMPTLIIAANLPDIDAGCAVLGTVSLAMRRGITHGPIALLVLPLLLTGAMIAFDRWQTRRGTRPAERLPVHTGWLLALAYIGCLSHPLFDWMNSYGIRLLEPFSHRWFYGDALFIVDPWLLAALGLGVFFSLRLERWKFKLWAVPAWVAITLIATYVGVNRAISARAAAASYAVLTSTPYKNPVSRHVRVVANPVPLKFWQRQILWRDRDVYGEGSYDALTGKPFFIERDGLDHCIDRRTCNPPGWIMNRSIGMEDPRIAERVNSNPAARAFLFWSRMPVADRGVGDAIVIRDQRFLDSLTSSRFQVRLEP